jgi:hypothetical protein
MVAALSNMDVREKPLSLFWRYAPQRNPVGVDAVQLPFIHAVELGLLCDALCLGIILREGFCREEVLELGDLARSLRLQREEEAISRG